jgi:hypothetical protein
MSSEVSLTQIKLGWNDVLDSLERRDRIAWLAFFDARLASFESGVLSLDYSDSRKFGYAHEYSEARERHRQMLIESIQEHLGITVLVSELP